MILHPPFEISPRLLPGIKIGGAWVQLERIPRDGAKNSWRWTIDLESGHNFSGDELRTHRPEYPNAFADLLSFLSAFADSIDYRRRTGEGGDCIDLFPSGLSDWAVSSRDEIDGWVSDLEESESKLIEE